jgi:hypothetical protein
LKNNTVILYNYCVDFKIKGGFLLLTNFSELKTRAKDEMLCSFCDKGLRCGFALLSKDGKIYTGHAVGFPDGYRLDAVDMAVYSALADGKTRFLAGALCAEAAPSKDALVRLSSFSDMMFCLSIGETSLDTTLKKLLTQLGEK